MLADLRQVTDLAAQMDDCHRRLFVIHLLDIQFKWLDQIACAKGEWLDSKPLLPN